MSCPPTPQPLGFYQVRFANHSPMVRLVLNRSENKSTAGGTFPFVLRLASEPVLSTQGFSPDIQLSLPKFVATIKTTLYEMTNQEIDFSNKSTPILVRIGTHYFRVDATPGS